MIKDKVLTNILHKNKIDKVNENTKKENYPLKVIKVSTPSYYEEGFDFNLEDKIYEETMNLINDDNIKLTLAMNKGDI